MPTSYGQLLKLRLFLEGVEVPIISANIQTAPNSPMTAALQVPPLAEGTRLLPRTIVHLFFLDMYEQKSPFISNTTEQADTRSPTTHENRTAEKDSQDEFIGDDEVINSTSARADTRNGRYRLLFAGEIIGFQWTKNVASRSLVFQCADFSNYWDYAYQWNNTGIFGPGLKAVFSGGATNLFTDFLSSKGSVITRIVSSGRCNTYPKLKGLAAGIVRLIEAIGGTYQIRRSDGSVKKLAGQNIFFSLAELRLHITQMIAAFEDDPTSQRLLRRQGYSGLFNRAIGNLGGQTSIRKVINALTGIIFHETYAQPCPYYVSGLEGTVSGTVRQSIRNDPQYRFIFALAENSKQTVEDLLSTLQLDTDSNPELRVLSLAAFKVKVAQRMTLARGVLNRAQTDRSVRTGPSVIKAILSQSSRALGQARTRLNRWRPDAPDAEKQPVLESLEEARSQLDRLVNLTISCTKAGEQQPARLMQQVLRPDIWFGAPPRCNVLFPEDYEQFTYQRMFLQEPTRFLLKTNDEFFGEDFLFDKFYFAPQAGSLKAEQARLRNMLRNDLLEHELFTGILPVFEKMGEFNVFASRSGTQKNPKKVSFAQRAANFLYFKHRFNSRQMRIAGKFNPYIACGCPGLILDRYVDQETIQRHRELAERTDIEDRERLQLLGTNFLGNFTQTSHAVSQADARGRTEIVASYPRQVEESVEFLGAVEKTADIRKRQEKDALRATDVAALAAPRLFSLGPLGGIISNVTEVTQLYVRRSVARESQRVEDFFGENLADTIPTLGGRLLPLFGRKTRDRGGQARAPLVPIGVPTSAAQLGSTDVEDVVGDANREVIFRAYRVEEDVPRYKRERASLPAEEFIRPGWYGDIWSSSRIGRAYDTFFGIGAITDPQQVSDPRGATRAVPSEVEAQAQDEAATAVSEDDPKRNAPVLRLGEGSSIEQAVEFLALTYSYIRQEGLDVEEFARSYTWRPIATMVDMLGTSDLKYNPDGSAVVSGIEGFHSRAFGPYNDLFGLVGPEIEDVLGIKRSSVVAQKGDTRGRKQEAVQRYISSLLFSRGVLG